MWSIVVDIATLFIAVLALGMTFYTQWWIYRPKLTFCDVSKDEDYKNMVIENYYAFDIDGPYCQPHAFIKVALQNKSARAITVSNIRAVIQGSTSPTLNVKGYDLELWLHPHESLNFKSNLFFTKPIQIAAYGYVEGFLLFPCNGASDKPIELQAVFGERVLCKTFVKLYEESGLSNQSDHWYL